ncbi:NAD(+)/NADH kinase [Candidatus Falkowbacteria bacterium]|nr:NAD(+)/NADH kinase [Candidatus Falkowbacteria bacterium]
MKVAIFCYRPLNGSTENIERIAKTENALRTMFEVVPAREAELGLVIGGDGFMTKTVKECVGYAKEEGPQYIRHDITFYGINRGTYGFLMNDHDDADDVRAGIQSAEWIEFPLLEAEVREIDDSTISVLAFNDVFTKTTTAQSAKHRVRINGQNILGVDPAGKEIIYSGDGLLVCTPGGSTAYNRAAHGIIIDHRSMSLGLTPISPFLPIGFSPQLLPSNAEVEIEILEDDKRKHLVIADNIEFCRVKSVKIRKAKRTVTLGFKPNGTYFQKTLELRFPWLKGQTTTVKI